VIGDKPTYDEDVFASTIILLLIKAFSKQSRWWEDKLNLIALRTTGLKV
jgi:hypothetical protein